MHHSRLHTTKRVLARYTPALFRLIRASRRRLHARRNARLQGALAKWKAQFIERFDFVIQAGPFAGMQFHRSTAADAYLPLLIGSYEAETHGFIEQALAREPRIIVDVGCNAGFVAVGLARRAPAAQVHAFDIDAGARADTTRLSDQNGVTQRVTVSGECTSAGLEALCQTRALVFCDCEGFELELLDPEKVPALAHTDIIVELHDFMRTDIAITPTVLARFSDTHDIQIASVGGRAAADYRCLDIFPDHVRARALHEDRVQYQQWAFLKARYHTM